MRLFHVLAQKDIPTIATIPIFQEFEDYKKTRERARQLIEEQTDPSDLFNFISSQEMSVLSKAVSEDLIDYLREVKGERDNFYLVPTDYDLADGEQGLALGDLLGDYSYRCLELEIVSKFLEIVEGKEILFAGSNMPGCVDSTLGYFRYVDCKVRVLTNYLGTSRDINLGEFDEHLPEAGLLDHVLTHPQENEVSQNLLALFEERLKKIDERIAKNPFYKPSPNPIIVPDTRYF